MPRSGSIIPAPSYPWPRKAIRKGTRSCVECRRRKIRCYFKPENSKCIPCVERGSRCIDQREAIPTTNATKRDVSLQESSVDASPPKVQGTPRAEEAEPEVPHQTASSLNSRAVQHLGINPQLGDVDRRVPLVSVLYKADLVQHNAAPSLSADFAGSPNGARVVKTPAHEAKAVCKSLRKALPSYDAITLAIAENGAWWSSFRVKMRAFSEAPAEESIEEFAARAYTSRNPGEMGTLVVAFARSAGDSEHLYGLVESLVILNDAYSTTGEGLECLILLAKTYTDIGQPRKSWLLWRQATTLAQLMGLYQMVSTSPVKRSLWWEIYFGDRFTSLLLGLPYGFNDAHYGNAIVDIAMRSWPSALSFSLKGALLAGKVIDRNISLATPSFAHAMDLDEQMAAIATSMSDDWWKLPDLSRATDADLDSLSERLLLQFYFFHVKLYIHLPFIGHSFTEATSGVSKLKCMEAARELLRRFNLFRAENRKPCLFECKTTDFIAFTAVLVLLICLSQASDKMDRQFSDDDASLIAATQNILGQLETRGCKIASQCRRTLRFLFGGGSSVDIEANSRQLDGIRIPYFGTVVKRHMGTTLTPSTFPGVDEDTGSSSFSGPVSALSDMPVYQGVLPLSIDLSSIEYQSLEYQSLDVTGQSLVGSLWDVENTAGESYCSGLDTAMLDIDQEWPIFRDENKF